MKNKVRKPNFIVSSRITLIKHNIRIIISIQMSSILLHLLDNVKFFITFVINGSYKENKKANQQVA